MERKVRDSCGESVTRGDTKGAKAPRADRPRKASAWSGNQRSSCTSHKNVVAVPKGVRKQKLSK
ncbi:hypothetical protein [Peribacillus simplex]|uniref:hypothetical protein n=1 Tax=Peribacillus simplex TaxID=1478 RepID=UPI003D274CD0